MNFNDLIIPVGAVAGFFFPRPPKKRGEGGDPPHPAKGLPPLGTPLFLFLQQPCHTHRGRAGHSCQSPSALEFRYVHITFSPVPQLFPRLVRSGLRATWGSAP